MLPRILGAGLTSGVITYLVAVDSDPCEGTLAEAATVFLIAPLSAVIFSLPRVSWSSYLWIGLTSIIAVTVGGTWARTDQTAVRCEVLPFVYVFIGWIAPTIGVVIAAAPFALIGWLRRRGGA